MKKYRLLSILMLVVSVAFSGASHAEEKQVETTVKEPATEMADGVIRKVNKDTKKLTIKHGEIKSLDMPSMTMVFQVKDSTVFDKVKEGDKVKFTAEKLNGAIVITDLHKSE